MWRSLTSSGTHGTGWHGSWDQPPKTERDDALSVLCSGGMDVFDEDDQPDLTLCHYGFGGPGVGSIEVTTPGAEGRRIAVVPPWRSFIVITTDLPVRLTPIGRDGRSCSTAWDFER